VLISCFHMCCSTQSEDEDEVSDNGDYDADAAETAAERSAVRPVDEELEGVKGLRRESSRTAADDEEQSGSESEGEQGEDMETQQQVRFVTVACLVVPSGSWNQTFTFKRFCAVCYSHCRFCHFVRVHTACI
jgi:hypothetical protein